MQTAKIERITESLKRQGYTDRRIKNALVKEEAQEQAERNQKPVEYLTISIEWRKSKTWGSNPHATAEVHFADGTYAQRSGFTCSGCGYDKESTVIAQIFNDFLKYKLWELEGNDEKIKSKPYGIRLDFDYNPGFEGGVGTSCYYNIAEFLGGKFECVASGKTYDAYRLVMK